MGISALYTLHAEVVQMHNVYLDCCSALGIGIAELASEYAIWPCFMRQAESHERWNSLVGRTVMLGLGLQRAHGLHGLRYRRRRTAFGCRIVEATCSFHASVRAPHGTFVVV